MSKLTRFCRPSWLIAIGALLLLRAQWADFGKPTSIGIQSPAQISSPVEYTPAKSERVLLEGQELTFLPIREMELGMRVPGENPLSDFDSSLGDVDHVSWRKITCTAPKQDGTNSEISLLRPLEWLESQQATVGGKVHVSVPDCGIDGWASVHSIEPCPPIEDGPGHVVIGKFKHPSADVWDLVVDGVTEPIGTTGNHPFYSIDRGDFVRADQLQVGEQVETFIGPSQVISLSKRPLPQPVYNIEVHGSHVYHVSANGILVHNGNEQLCRKLLADMKWSEADINDFVAQPTLGRKCAYLEKKKKWSSDEIKAFLKKTEASQYGTLSNVDARKWYLEQEAKILSEIDPNLPLRERAIQAFNKRNELRTKARDLMVDRVLAEKLMREEPNMTLQELVRRKYKDKGLVGDALWQDILDSSQKSRTSVNKKLGLE